MFRVLTNKYVVYMYYLTQMSPISCKNADLSDATILQLIIDSIEIHHYPVDT